MVGKAVHIVLAELERQEVGVGKIAVVVRLFLRAHRPRLAGLGIEQPRLLLDRAAVFHNVDLPSCLMLDGLADKADRIDVLDLAARAERRSRLSHRDVDVGAQDPLLHVAVAGAEIAHDGAQLGEIGLGLLRTSGGRASTRSPSAPRPSGSDRRRNIWDAGRAGSCRRPARDAAARCRRRPARRRARSTITSPSPTIGLLYCEI